MEFFGQLTSLWLKFFFLLTPFCGLSSFLVFTKEKEIHDCHKIAIKTTLTIVITFFILYYFGNYIFKVFGITIDAFRIGAGVILFLSGLDLVRNPITVLSSDKQGDISIVPLAIPIIVGPGTIGTVLVIGAENNQMSEHFAACIAFILSSLSVGVLLYLADNVERIIGKTGLNVLSKVSGLILSALAAQIIFTGIKNFLNLNL